MKAELMMGDCLELMRALPDASVDMILCDLPYGTTKCAWDIIVPFDAMWAEYRRITKPNAAIVLTAGQPFTTKLIGSNLRDFRYSWVWEKDQGVNFQSCKNQPLKKHEDICVFYRARPTYNPQGLTRLAKPRIKSNKGKGGRLGHMTSESKRAEYTQDYTGYPSSVLRFTKERGLHPTQKPVALMEYLVRTYTKEGAVVLDNCMGSGTTGVACANTGRRFIGMEMDPKYFAIARDRILAAMPAPANDNESCRAEAAA